MSNDQKAVSVTRFRPGCQQLLFLYQGGGGMFFMPPMRFLRYCGANKRSLSLLRDPTANYYHGALNDDCPNIDATIAHQRRIKRQCAEATQFYCSGTSMGAYASILFGHYLEADIVYAFGARSKLGDGHVESSIDVPPQHRDLELLLGNWNGRTRYRLYYSKDYEPDRLSAERIAHCPGVELFPQPGRTHNVFKEIKARKFLRNLLPPLEEPRWWRRQNLKQR